METVAKTYIDKKNKNSSINKDTTIKKQSNCNQEINHVDQSKKNKDQYKKNEFYPLYSSNCLIYPFKIFLF